MIHFPLPGLITGGYMMLYASYPLFLGTPRNERFSHCTRLWPSTCRAEHPWRRPRTPSCCGTFCAPCPGDPVVERCGKFEDLNAGDRCFEVMKTLFTGQYVYIYIYIYKHIIMYIYIYDYVYIHIYI